MTEGPFRRIALTMLFYTGAAWVVLELSGWLRRVLALPALFETLLFWGVCGGAGLAAYMAWKYPEIVAEQEQRAGPPDSGP